ncbi:MAG: hypothetical protein IPI43_17005 [Sandaracinaceae bacterium]|nr:hypothetical protein [Sandaracinaceae bacterium]
MNATPSLPSRRPARRLTPLMQGALLLLLLVLVPSCASVPRDSYGVRRLRFEGVEALDSDALRACLATRERPSVGIDFGTASEPTCGEPPFDGGSNTMRLWHWP